MAFPPARTATRCVEIDPNHVAANFNLAVALKTVLKDFDGAQQHYIKTTELAPYHTAAHLFLGNLLYERKKIDEAEARYRRALELNPQLTSAHIALGILLKDARSDDEGAKRCLRRAIELDENRVLAYIQLGMLLRKRQDYGGAEVAYRKAMELDPLNTDAHCNLGNLMVCMLKETRRVREGDSGLFWTLVMYFDGAKKAYLEAIEIFPNHADAHFGLANLMKDEIRMDLAMAEREYRKTILINPNHADAHFNLANLLNDAERKEGKDTRGVERELRHAIAINPNHAAAHWNLHLLLESRAAHDSELGGAMHEVAEFMRSGGHDGVDGKGKLAALAARKEAYEKNQSFFVQVCL